MSAIQEKKNMKLIEKKNKKKTREIDNTDSLSMNLPLDTYHRDTLLHA